MKKTLLLFGMALCFTACQHYNDADNIKDDNSPKFSIKAILDDGDAARTIVDNAGKVKWEMGDRINLMRKTSDVVVKKSVFSVCELHNSGKMATFEESILSIDDFDLDAYVSYPFYFAGYPDTKFQPIEEFPFYVECDVNATQKYEAGKMVAQACNPAYSFIGKEDFEANQTLHFKNLFGILHLQFVGNDKITQIDFMSHENSGSSDRPVCGKYKFCPDEQIAFLNPDSWSDKGYTVTLDCGEGVQLDSSIPTDFYIVLPPATYSYFTIMVHDPDRFLPLAYTTYNSHTIARSKIHTIAPLTFNKE